MSHIIPIVFSTDNEYVNYSYIAIFSAIKNAGKNYRYKIFVFNVDLNDKNIELLESLSNQFAEVKCINIKSIIGDIELKGILHLSAATYYRLFIAEIFDSYDKVLYLDSDIIVRGDVSALYQVNMDDYPIAAALDVRCSNLEEHRKTLGIKDSSMMFNAGVILINTKSFIEQEIKQKCLKKLKEDYKRKIRRYVYADQDLLVTVLQGQFKQIDTCWNYQWQYLWKLDTVNAEYRKEYAALSEKPFIIHYAGDKKPWAYPRLPLADSFWKIAEETGLTYEVFDNSLEQERRKKEALGCFSEFRLPYEKLSSGCKVAIYGAGLVGKDFVEQLRRTLFADKVLWVDKGFKDKPKEWNVESPEMLISGHQEYDYVVVAIDNKSIANDIIGWMKDGGIKEEKIVWQDYRRSVYEG